VPNPHHSHGLHLLQNVAPPEPFITLSEAKEWARIDEADADGLMTVALETACKMLDGYDGLLGKAVGEQRWSLAFQCLRGEERAYLPVTPVLAVTAISYWVDGVETAGDVNDFTLYANEDWAYVVPNDGTVWPTGLDDREDAIKITWRAGFGDIDAVPVDLKTCAKILARSLYDYPDAASADKMMAVPFGAQTIIDKYRKGWVA